MMHGLIPGDPPVEEELEIRDLRKLFAATGLPLSEKGNKTGKYKKRNIQHIAYAAKQLGVDPLTAVAISMQESKLGNVDENLGHVLWQQLKDDQGYRELEQKYKNVDPNALALSYVLRQKIAHADKFGYKDEALRLQGYNGWGKISANTEREYHKALGVNPNILYGLDLTKTGPIDMRQNPLYGKTVIDLRDNVLRQNPHLLEFISGSVEGKIPLMPYGGNPEPPKAWDGTPLVQTKEGMFVENDEGDLIPLDTWNKMRMKRKTGMAARLVP